MMLLAQVLRQSVPINLNSLHWHNTYLDIHKE